MHGLLGLWVADHGSGATIENFAIQSLYGQTGTKAMLDKMVENRLLGTFF